MKSESLLFLFFKFTGVLTAIAPPCDRSTQAGAEDRGLVHLQAHRLAANSLTQASGAIAGFPGSTAALESSEHMAKSSMDEPCHVREQLDENCVTVILFSLDKMTL
jgi:hypothetical protein